MQLVSIVPAPSSHRECYMRITVTMPTAKPDSMVWSQDGIHLMIDYFTDYTLAKSDDGPRLESTLPSECQTESHVKESMIPNSNSIIIPNHH